MVLVLFISVYEVTLVVRIQTVDCLSLEFHKPGYGFGHCR